MVTGSWHWKSNYGELCFLSKFSLTAKYMDPLEQGMQTLCCCSFFCYGCRIAHSVCCNVIYNHIKSNKQLLLKLEDELLSNAE